MTTRADLRLRLTPVRVVLVVALLAAAVGCVEDGDEDGLVGIDRPLDADDLEAELADSTPGGLIPEGARTDDSQRQLLADGEVSYEDYEQSVLRTIDCMRDSGLVVSDPVPSRAGRFLEYQYEVTTPAGESVDDYQSEADEKYARCYIAHSALVSEAWLRATTLTEEERSAVLQDLAQCLRDEGLVIAEAESITPEEIRVATEGIELTPRMLDCFDLYRDPLVTPDVG